MSSEKDEIISFLSNPSKLAVIGASTKSHRAGYYVPKFLNEKGFDIIPVNPRYVSILGNSTYESILDVPEYDAVIVYRNQQDAIKQAKSVIDEGKAKLIWFPDDIVSEEIAQLCKESDIKFVQNRCPLRDYKAFIGS